MAGTGDCDNEPSGCIKCGEFIDWLKKLLVSEEGLCCVE